MTNTQTRHSEAIALYIHWPFCLSLCPYCDFNSHLGAVIDEKIWLQAYQQELDHLLNYSSFKSVKSIFFGGGTPSLMPPTLVEKLLNYISNRLSPTADIEITLEANPTSFEINKFRNFKSAGINRVSIGVQSLDDQILKFLGRKHSSQQAEAAALAAAELFERYSIDLIYAVPKQTLSQWQAQLIKAMQLANGHISLYQLTIEKGTPFFKQHKQGEFQLPEDELAADMYQWTNDYLQQAGYQRYEISNYAVTSHECRHNLVYWYYQDYLGIGPGAHSRLTNTQGELIAGMSINNPDKWLSSVNKLGHGLQHLGKLNQQDIIKEFLMMGLRLPQGINQAAFKKRTNLEFEEVLDLVALQLYQRHQFVTYNQQNLRLTDKGLMLHNYLVPRLLK